MEFLMTYGWAILVVLAAIAALAYFGVLSPDRFFPDKCIVQGGGFSCVESRVSDGAATDTITVVLRNSGGSNMQSVNVTLSSETTSCDVTGGDFIAVGGLNNGDSTNPLVFNCTSATALDNVNKFRGTLTIDYLPDEATLWQKAEGSITKSVTQ
jgi:hypothetical protein